jgi:hypothetical protein
MPAMRTLKVDQFNEVDKLVFPQAEIQSYFHPCFQKGSFPALM